MSEIIYLCVHKMRNVFMGMICVHAKMGTQTHKLCAHILCFCVYGSAPIASAILETYVKIVNFPPGRAHDGFPSYHEEKGHYDGKIRDILLGKFGITRISTMYRGTIFLIVM